MSEAKVDRKLLKRPDAFVARGRDAMGWLFAQRVRMIPVVAVVVVLAAGLSYWDYRGKNRQKQAWEAYFLAQKVDATRRADDYKALHDRFPETRAGLFAAVGAADAQLRKGRETKDAGAYTDAAVWYGKALTFGSLQPLEKQLIHLDRAEAYLGADKGADAQKDLETAVGLNAEGKGLALLELGRLYEKQGNAAKAKETYERLAADGASTEAGRLGKSFLRRMNSPLFETAPPPKAVAEAPAKKAVAKP